MLEWLQSGKQRVRDRKRDLEFVGSYKANALRPIKWGKILSKSTDKEKKEK